MERKRCGQFNLVFVFLFLMSQLFCWPLGLPLCFAEDSPPSAITSASIPPASITPGSIEKKSWSLPFEVSVELTSSEVSDGSVILVSVKTQAENSELSKAYELKGSFEGIQLAFYPVEGTSNYETVLGVPYSMKPGIYPIQIQILPKDGRNQDPKGEKWIYLSVRDGKYGSEQLQVTTRHLNPTKKDLKRIERDKEVVGRIYANVTPQKFWKGAFRFPLQSAITSVFGTKRMLNGERQSFHSGLDFRASVGTKVYAPAGGVVVLAEDLFFTGKTVMIDHGYGVITFCAHLSKIKVKKGARLKTGDLLGLSGNTGRVSGPHLHWQAIVHRTKVNPMDLTKVLR